MLFIDLGYVIKLGKESHEIMVLQVIASIKRLNLVMEMRKHFMADVY
jgi:hypothetical protein